MSSSSLRLPWTGVRSLVVELAPAGAGRGRRPRWVAPVLSIAGGGLFGLLVWTHGGEFLNAIDRSFHASWQLLAIAAVLEAASVAGYVLLLHGVVSPASPRLRLKDSYDITLGGAAATRLLPTAGLGGAAVTVWALRAQGVRPSEIAERLLAFLLLIYSVFMSALLVAGAAVALGLVKVSAGRGLGIVGVAVAVTVSLTVLILLAAPSSLAGVLGRATRGSDRIAAVSHRLTKQLPVFRGALRRAWLELRRPHPALLGAVAWWGFDIGVLLTMLHAFGVKLPIAAVVLAYFLGTMLNVVPLPGSLSGGLAASLVALGSPVGGAITAVLAYRLIAVWLPAAPGITSLASLRRSATSWRGSTAVITTPPHSRSSHARRARRRRHDLEECRRAADRASIRSAEW